MSSAAEPVVSRRDLLKAGAAAGAVGAIGTGTLPEPINPIGESEAILPLIGISAGAVAGAKVGEWLIEGDTDVDETDVLQDQIYETGLAVGEGRSAFVEEMTRHFVDTAVGESPFAAAAWSEVRAETVRGFVNGLSESEAQANCLDAVQLTAARAVANAQERWNTGITALMPSMVIELEENVGALEHAESDHTLSSFTASAAGGGGWTGVPDGEVVDGSGEFVVFEGNSDLPTDPRPDSEKQQKILSFGMLDDSGNQEFAAPGGGSWMEPTLNVGGEALRAVHPDASNQTVLDGQPHHDALTRIKTEYDDITSNISDYVSAVYAQIEEGAIDPADILGASEVVNIFSGAGPQQRLAAEMLVIGAEVPGEKAFEAKVSHPDLTADSVWGNLFFRSVDGVSIDSLNPGQTIASTDYHVAYLGFFSGQTGEFTTRVLSGSSDLQILDVRNLPGQEDVADEAAADAADENADVVVWDSGATEQETPDPIAFPADHSNWNIVVHGASGTRSIHSPSELVESDGTWTLEATDLNAGEAIERIQLVPPAEVSQPVKPVVTPTDPDDGQTAERLQNLRQEVDELEELAQSGGGGGFGRNLIPPFPLDVPVPDSVAWGGTALGGVGAVSWLSSTLSP